VYAGVGLISKHAASCIEPFEVGVVVVSDVTVAVCLYGCNRCACMSRVLCNWERGLQELGTQQEAVMARADSWHPIA
jgi:hypothetical protein